MPQETLTIVPVTLHPNNKCIASPTSSIISSSSSCSIKILHTEFADFLSLREAVLSESAYAHDCLYLTSFDSYLTECNLQQKEVSESVITVWVKNLSGKSSPIANKVMVIRLSLRYLSSIGIRVFIPPIPKVTNDFVANIFSDEDLKGFFLI